MGLFFVELPSRSREILDLKKEEATMKSSSVIVSLLISSVAASALPKRTTLRPCTYAEIALATGIHLNIE